MTYNWGVMKEAIEQAEEATRLSAAIALEQALREAVNQGQTDWTTLSEQVLPALIKGIGDRNKGVQVHSANCLALLCPLSPEVIPQLQQRLRGADLWGAWGAALVLARMGFWFPEMEIALSEAMGATDRDVRWAAAGFSLQLGRDYPQAVEMVKQTLRAQNPLARKMAAYCLGAMGQYASVEDVLVHLLSDEERDVRRAAILAIDKLPTISAHVGERIALLRADPDEFVRRTATAVASKLGYA